MRLRDLLDPDRDWRTLATILHYAGCFVLCALFDALPGFVGISLLGAFLLTVWTAAVYEAGQTDAAYSIKDAGGKRYAGRPGFGFGLMDLAAGILGALTWAIPRWFLAAVLG